jgi:hypothetical protein
MSCIVDSAAIYIMVVKFRNTIFTPTPQLSLHRRAALPSNSNGTLSAYSRKNSKGSLYCMSSIVEAQGNLPVQWQSTCGGGTDSHQLESARQSEETSAAAQPITTSARRDTSIYTSTEIHLDQSVSNSHCVIISASGRYNW